MFDPELLAMIAAAVAVDPRVPTLADRQPNTVREVTRDGVWVETRKTLAQGRPPQLVPAWMIQIGVGLAARPTAPSRTVTCSPTTG